MTRTEPLEVPDTIVKLGATIVKFLPQEPHDGLFMFGGIILASYNYKQFIETFDTDFAVHSFYVLLHYTYDRSTFSEFLDKLLAEISIVRTEIVDNITFPKKK